MSSSKQTVWVSKHKAPYQQSNMFIIFLFIFLQLHSNCSFSSSKTVFFLKKKRSLSLCIYSFFSYILSLNKNLLCVFLFSLIPSLDSVLRKQVFCGDGNFPVYVVKITRFIFMYLIILFLLLLLLLLLMLLLLLLFLLLLLVLLLLLFIVIICNYSS